MRRIDKLLPDTGACDLDRLRAYDADALARYAADPAHAWWRRRHCVHALAGRVPEPWVGALLSRIRDTGDTGEVRIALLDLLGGRAELVPWLRHEDRGAEYSSVFDAILKARAVCGDLSAAGELAALAFDPWAHRRAIGEAGMDALVDRLGVDVVLAVLGDARPAERAFRVRARARVGEDVTDALADPERAVAYLAQSLLRDPDRLRRYLDEAPTVEARVWAAYALHNLTEDTAETRAVDDALGRPRVEVAGLDEEIRRAIVHEYAPVCQRDSDPRWRLEGVCTEPPAEVDISGQLRRASAALAAAGLDPAPPVHCGDDSGQGDGTYHIIRCGENRFYISTLGRFATCDDDDDNAHEALESAGFRWIDETIGSIRVTDLCVYYFGDRVPLGVATLLFYWQD
ncbi:hypothetical protein [Embleya sp. AB8]|uniref:hypothetical protein n=1 Tax=Embleya sp. AB8 TaxID=3156304 RepID=UPI003C70A526